MPEAALAQMQNDGLGNAHLPLKERRNHQSAQSSGGSCGDWFTRFSECPVWWSPSLPDVLGIGPEGLLFPIADIRQGVACRAGKKSEAPLVLVQRQEFLCKH
jgi:hypothetical protein